MILNHESGSQEDQLDGKKEGQKSRGPISLSLSCGLEKRNSEAIVIDASVK